MSVGKVGLDGKLVHSAVGSARLVPVKVSSTVCPLCIPSGNGTFKVGAWGGAATGPAFGWATTAPSGDDRATMTRIRASSGQTGRRRERIGKDLERGRRGGGGRGGRGGAGGGGGGKGAAGGGAGPHGTS